jgi:DNA mismatch endonuclease (patch repair protein)
MDTMSRKRRSQLMSSIKSRGNKRTELAMAKLLRSYHVTGWRRHLQIPGKPDFVFRSNQAALFIEGCFWNGCPNHYSAPTSNAAFWHKKFLCNKKNDQAVNKKLKSRGWRVLRLWEHDLQLHPRLCIRRVIALLAKDKVPVIR